MKLYHLTWDIYVADILREGLVPGRKPSNWSSMKGAKDRSAGKVFLCDADRAEYWEMTTYENADAPEGAAALVLLEVDASGLDLQADRSDREGPDFYAGDWWLAGSIPADRVSITLEGAPT